MRFCHRLILVTSLLVGSLSVPAFAQPPQVPSGGDREPTPPPPTPPEEPPPEAPPPPGEEPPFEEPAPPPEIVVRGSERLVWDQPVAAYEALAGLTFRIYVDGGPRPLDVVSCARNAGPSGVECQAPLPRLSPGVHTLWMSAVSPAPEYYEGSYSWPIVVRMAGGDVGAAGTSARSAPPGPSPLPPLPTALPVLTTGLDDPTDLASLPDGSLLIAERAGRIRWFREGEALRTV